MKQHSRLLKIKGEMYVTMHIPVEFTVEDTDGEYNPESEWADKDGSIGKAYGWQLKHKKVSVTNEDGSKSLKEKYGLKAFLPIAKNYSFSQTPRLNTIASLETNESISSLKEISSPELDFPDKASRKMRFEQIMRGKFPENIILIEKNESTNKKKPQMISVNNNYSKPKESEKNKKFEGKLNKNSGNVLRQKLLATKQ